MRDRLIGLIKEHICSLNIGGGAAYFLCSGVPDLADHLLAEGVIVPPCKVGDKTFLLLEKMIGGYDILESKCVAISENIFIKVYSMFIDCAEISNTLEYKLEDFGRWVFLTKEEAEKALEERNSDDET